MKYKWLKEKSKKKIKKNKGEDGISLEEIEGDANSSMSQVCLFLTSELMISKYPAVQDRCKLYDIILSFDLFISPSPFFFYTDTKVFFCL